MTGPLPAVQFLSRFPVGNSSLPGRHGQAMRMVRNPAMTVVPGLVASGCGGGGGYVPVAGEEGMQSGRLGKRFSCSAITGRSDIR